MDILGWGFNETGRLGSFQSLLMQIVSEIWLDSYILAAEFPIAPLRFQEFEILGGGKEGPHVSGQNSKYRLCSIFLRAQDVDAYCNYYLSEREFTPMVPLTGLQVGVDSVLVDIHKEAHGGGRSQSGRSCCPRFCTGSSQCGMFIDESLRCCT